MLLRSAPQRRQACNARGPGARGRWLITPRLQRDRNAGWGTRRALGRTPVHVRAPSGNAHNHRRIRSLRASAVCPVHQDLGNGAPRSCARRSARGNAEEPASLALPASRHPHEGMQPREHPQGLPEGSLQQPPPLGGTASLGATAAARRRPVPGTTNRQVLGRIGPTRRVQVTHRCMEGGPRLWGSGSPGAPSPSPGAGRQQPSPRRRRAAGPPRGARRCPSCTACCKATISESAIAL